ncbi:MAG: hypothetical protein JXA78_17060 [Anaerolineales bacterium]|nr:hypothetical protein [Anaerolineales bacterium]
MKIRSDIRAGDALAECQEQRDYWKAQADYMEKIATSPTPTPTPPITPPTSTGGSGCGWINGIYYPDRSGACG